jgi:hypothetical protein
MAPRSLRRRLSSAALIGSLALLPTAAGALPLFNLDRQAAIHEEAEGILAWLGEVFIRIWAEDSDTGMIIDPDGNPRPNGTSEGDTGKLIDPNG